MDKGQRFSGGRIAAAAVVGGTASEITGGKFANGAMTGAFSRAFNDEMQHGAKARTIREYRARIEKLSELDFGTEVATSAGIDITDWSDSKLAKFGEDAFLVVNEKLKAMQVDLANTRANEIVGGSNDLLSPVASGAASDISKITGSAFTRSLGAFLGGAGQIIDVVSNFGTEPSYGSAVFGYNCSSNGWSCSPDVDFASEK